MNRIGVYKTDVEDESTAKNIISAIRRQFRNYNVSFDLGDCDNVLRVENENGPEDEAAIRQILQEYGYRIERLT